MTTECYWRCLRRGRMFDITDAKQKFVWINVNGKIGWRQPQDLNGHTFCCTVYWSLYFRLCLKYFWKVPAIGRGLHTERYRWLDADKRAANLKKDSCAVTLETRCFSKTNMEFSWILELEWANLPRGNRTVQSVCVMTLLHTIHLKNRGSVTDRSKTFFLYCKIPTGSGAYQVPYLRNFRKSSWRKVVGTDIHLHLVPKSSIPISIPHLFLKCLIK
jgi:hypothetical protein